MAWELTVSDKMSSWGYGGKIFKPGIYVITNGDIAAKAETETDGRVTVRVIDAKEAAVLEQFSEQEDSGMLTHADLQAKVGVDFICTVEGCTSPPFKTQRTLNQHQGRTHLAEEVEAADTAVAEAEAAAAAPEEEEIDELVEEPA